MLHRLELPDRAAELDPVEGPLHRLVEDVFERARHLLAPHHRAQPDHRGRVETGRRLRELNGLNELE